MRANGSIKFKEFSCVKVISKITKTFSDFLDSSELHYFFAMLGQQKDKNEVEFLIQHVTNICMNVYAKNECKMSSPHIVTSNTTCAATDFSKHAILRMSINNIKAYIGWWRNQITLNLTRFTTKFNTPTTS